jgi:hypothetical protein
VDQNDEDASLSQHHALAVNNSEVKVEREIDDVRKIIRYEEF